MVTDRYQYVLEVFRDETLLVRVPMEVDWEPAREWARYSWQRAGRLAIDDVAGEERVEPMWHTETGEPYVLGFRIALDANGAGELGSEFPATYFSAEIGRVSSELIEQEKVQAGDRLRYIVSAFPWRSEGDASRPLFTAKEEPPAISVVDSSLEEFQGKSELLGAVEGDDGAVFAPRGVLDEVTRLAKAAESVETGGILIGRLHRDSRPEIFVEVTAQIAARHVEADSTRLTFTSETWDDVRSALALRKRGEVMLGWWHSHPVKEWCKNCAPERQRVCSMSNDFFSAHDRALHRTIFPRAYSIALVANHQVDGRVTFSMFGWRRGSIEARGFNVLLGHQQAAL